MRRCMRVRSRIVNGDITERNATTYGANERTEANIGGAVVIVGIRTRTLTRTRAHNQRTRRPCLIRCHWPDRPTAQTRNIDLALPPPPPPPVSHVRHPSRLQQLVGHVGGERHRGGYGKRGGGECGRRRRLRARAEPKIAAVARRGIFKKIFPIYNVLHDTSSRDGNVAI